MAFIPILLLVLCAVTGARAQPTLSFKETLLVKLEPWPTGTSGTQADVWPFGFAMKWTKDMRRVGYWVADQTGMFLVVDGVRGKPFPTTDDGSQRGAFDPPGFEFSEDGTHFWYEASRNEKSIVVVDGKESLPYDSVRDLVWSPDGKHFAFVGQRGKHYLVVRDGQEGSGYDWIAPADLHFSADSQRMAYWVRRGGQDLTVMHEGPTVKEFGFKPRARNSPAAEPRVGDSTWNPGYGKSSSFLRDGKTVLVVNGVESRPYEYLEEESLTFGPDSQHFAHYAVEQGKTFLVVDGVEVEQAYEDSTGKTLPRIRFDTARTLRTLVIRDGSLFRVDVAILGE